MPSQKFTQLGIVDWVCSNNWEIVINDIVLVQRYELLLTTSAFDVTAWEVPIYMVVMR